MARKWRIRRVVLLVPVLALAVAAILFSVPQPAAAAPDLSTPGSLQVIAQPGEVLRSCPLEHTDVEGWVTGDIAHVRVTQRFGNPFPTPLEAVYVFPLPENAAVNDMVMRLGSRTIRGVMQKREEAKATYERAKQEGKTASLLEQERPNIFTQSVANIMPGDRIEITIWYVQDLRYDAGKYNFVFPMVVGPRYIPGQATGQQAGGWAPDTDRVPDASRLTPPVLKPNERTGHDISLTLHLDAGVPAYDLACKSHDIDTKNTGGEVLVTLAPHDTLPNKDFDFSWRVAGAKPELGVLSYRDDRSGYFTLMLVPKASFRGAEITPKEMVFCLDTSGSMQGLPIEKSKEVVTQCLQQMGPHDTFQIIRFSGDTGTFAPAPVPATPENIKKATEFINAMQGSGGTEMLKGLEASLAFPANPRQVRIVAFLTDGYIGNETEILARLQQKLGNARLFSFGIGSSVNRYLLTKMAQTGRGAVQFVRWDEQPEEAVQSFVTRLARPYLTDLTIDWGGLQVADLCPSYVPDLFADQPLVLHGRYLRPGQGTVTLRGRVAGQPWQTSLAVDFTEANPENEAIGVLWARTAIEDLMDSMFERQDPQTIAAVTDLALTYRLMSPYTSFVAVEEKVVNQGGQQTTIQIPVPMPEGVSYGGVFGEPANAVTVGSLGLLTGMTGSPAAPADRAQRKVRVGDMGRGVVATPTAEQAVTTGSLAGPAGPAAYYERAADGWSEPTVVPPSAWLVLASPAPDATLTAAASNLARTAQGVIGVPAGLALGADLQHLTAIPPTVRVLLLTGPAATTLDAAVQTALATYLKNGGFLLLDGANPAFAQSQLALLTKLLPEAKLHPLPASHPLYGDKALPYKLANLQAGQALYLGDRMVAYLSPLPLTPAWSAAETAPTQPAHRLTLNVVAYALQHPAQK